MRETPAIQPSADSTNQPPPLAGFNAWSGDRTLREAVEREGGGWIFPRANEIGELVGSERMQVLAAQANRFSPELRTHDRFGNRIDSVEYHPAYHELMALAFRAGLHSLAWTEKRAGAWVARAALNYLWNQGENGVACPVTMTFASVKVLRNDPDLAAEWESKLLACDYDPRPLPLAQKRAVTIGMAMTERQGGSDLRTNLSRATPAGGGGDYELSGQKWFCSAPMSDAFFTLATTGAGLTCFFVPRSLQDGTRNPFLIQRLKDKCGNRSNASSEIEYRGTRARIIGEEGRGIATLIAMAHLTRFDIVVASAGMMRAALNQALHHAMHRHAFGRRLAEQPLMQNVLADLALETEAATLLAFRLARAFDRAEEDPRERALMRLMTPIAKYWLCKRLPAFVAEAMECLGGNGYVEEAPLARLYREAPLNGIWEGSGNVICLDALRSLERAPESLEALLEEIRRGGARSRNAAAAIPQLFKGGGESEFEARRIVETVAVALQASLMERHALPEAADAFCASRLERDGGRAFGTLPPATSCEPILKRARPS
ncbi:MAG TPA: acyl-CoA dehydrogenase family protein [Burkholderiales bacterium]|nr:acyl-CoA dehydrogenase family protein [Burkholderiales bacterium]